MSAICQASEIFTSIQGEGLYVGERQIFIRFAGCNLSCQYCDTPSALAPQKQYKVEETPGKKDFKNFDNPAALEELLSVIDRLARQKELNHSISLTGGEPLLQVDFLKTFIPEVKKIKLQIYLETNGVLPKHLEEIIENVDIISMDIKLPSATGLSSYTSEHKKTLEIAAQKDVFVKIVFTRESKAKEIDEASQLIAEVNDEIPLILQPVTPFGPIKHRPNPDQMLAFHAIAKRRLINVRIIPQVHRIMGLS
jgi:organic radical activating enzyme